MTDVAMVLAMMVHDVDIYVNVGACIEFLGGDDIVLWWSELDSRINQWQSLEKMFRAAKEFNM